MQQEHNSAVDVAKNVNKTLGGRRTLGKATLGASAANTAEAGALLKKWRQEAGLTMRSLAVPLGVPHSYFGKVENNERRIDVTEFFTISKALGVDFETAAAALMACFEY